MKKNELFNLLAQNTHEIIPELATDSLLLNDQFGNLGINSTDRVEIIALTLESLSLDTPLSLIEVFNATSLSDLVDMLYRKLNQKNY